MWLLEEIQWNIWRKLNDKWLDENVSGDWEYALHHQETCLCDNGKIGKDKKAAANKKYYADKAREKHDLIRQLKKLKTSRNDAELTKETIAKLMDLL